MCAMQIPRINRSQLALISQSTYTMMVGLVGGAGQKQRIAGETGRTATSPSTTRTRDIPPGPVKFDCPMDAVPRVRKKRQVSSIMQVGCEEGRLGCWRGEATLSWLPASTVCEGGVRLASIKSWVLAVFCVK